MTDGKSEYRDYNENEVNQEWTGWGWRNEESSWFHDQLIRWCISKTAAG